MGYLIVLAVVLAAVVDAALLVLARVVARAGRDIRREIYLYRGERNQPPTTIDAEAWERPLHQMELRLDDLRTALADGIARVDRSEKRIQKTVTSARRLVQSNGLEHAGIEAEFDELEEPLVQAALSLDPPEPEETFEDDRPTGIPGISRARLEELRRGA